MALVSALPITARAQTPDTTHAGFTISGYGEASYSYSTAAVGNTVVGRLYDRFQDQFALNGFNIVLDKPAATDMFDAGVHADVLLGQNAAVLHPAGLDLGNQGDLTQLYITLNIPTANGNGIQLQIGKMATLLGLEVIDDLSNPNWSEGNQFTFVENFTQVGVSARHEFNDHIDAQLSLTNGWDVVQDNNMGKSVMGRIGIYPDSVSSIGIVGFYGAEQPNSSARRYGGELLVNRRVGGRATVWLQGDYGKEEASENLPDPTNDADWWALGGWLSLDLSRNIGLAFRGDYVDDRDGARTSEVLGFLANTGQQLTSATVTLNVRTWRSMLIRPEVRFDHSSLAAFGGRSEQATFALSVAYFY